MRLLAGLLLVMMFAGCATADTDSQGPYERSDFYAKRMQGRLLAEQRRGVELDNKIKEEQLKQLQLQNT